LVKIRLRASQVRFGDRLVGSEGEPDRLVIQVRRTTDGFLLCHDTTTETQFVGDPFVWILRRQPSVIEEELPHTIWQPRKTPRIRPWEGGH
jgi:hypothetical protein